MNTKKPKFNPALRKTRTFDETYRASIEELFPLYCPIREFDYMRDWSCTMRYSRSGYAELNAIFQSGYPFPPGMKATWVCTKYEKNEALTYTVFIPKAAVIVIDHQFEPLSDNETRHIVEITGFGLNFIGKKLVEKMFEGKRKRKNWRENMQEEIRYYLKYGKKIGKNDGASAAQEEVRV